MTTEDWRLARTHFEALVDLPAEVRARHLAELALDPGARALLLRLLEAADAADDSVEAAVHREVARVEREAQLSLGPGSRVGAYRIERLLGEGGMGEVFLARRDDGRFDSLVAIKFLSVSGSRAKALFDRERHLLARMSDPSITRLLDAGEDDRGRHYLVMEYVEGQPITEYVRAQGLSLSARLHLMRRAAQAIDHAHQLLVVHRDVKPAHLLVDAGGTLHILDFGISTLIDPETGAVNSTMGQSFTPRYAAPEQILGEPSTHAVDIYALGLVLFELLAGRHPFEEPDELMAAMNERKLADRGRGVRRASDLDPICARRLGRRQIRDLGAILQTALARKPANRYRTCADLADDLDRFMAGKPVRARSESRREATLRWVTNHRLAAASLALAGLSLTVGSAAALLAANDAQRQRDAAIASAARANLLGDYIKDVFSSAQPWRTAGEKISAEQLLSSGVKALNSHARPLPREVVAEVSLLLGEMQTSIGDFADAKVQLHKAVEISRELGAEASMRRAQVALGQAQVALGEYEQALETFAAVIGTDDRLPLDEPRVRAMLRSAYVHTQQGDLGQAERLMARLAPRLSEFPGLGRNALQLLGGFHSTRANIERTQGHHEKRVASALIALDFLTRHYGTEKVPEIADLYSDLGAAYASLGLSDKSRDASLRSLTITEDILDEKHPSALISRMNFASSLLQSHPDEARSHSRRVLDLLDSIPDRPPYPWEGVAHFVHARSLEDAGELSQAAHHMQRAAMLVEQRLGRANYRHGQYLASLARIRGKSGTPDEAALAFEAGISSLLESVGATHQKTLEAELDRIVFLTDAGRLRERDALWSDLWRRASSVYDSDDTAMLLLRVLSPQAGPTLDDDFRELARHAPNSSIGYMVEVARRYHGKAGSSSDARRRPSHSGP